MLNFLPTAPNEMQMADFGFVKKVLTGTRTNTLCGTPEYLAPEIITQEGHWQVGFLGSSLDGSRAVASLPVQRCSNRPTNPNRPTTALNQPQAADWWSVGVLIYELVAGVAFDGMQFRRDIGYRAIEK